MSWRIFTDDWRLKLLAVGLAVLMLAAVAFSQNPPTSATLAIGLSYQNSSDNPVVLINPPNSIKVTVTGLSNQIAIVTAHDVFAVVDISHAKPGPGQRLNVTATTTIRGPQVEQPPPIVVDVDSLTTKELPMEVKTTAAPGWSISGTPSANPATVHFTGPSTWMANLHAYAIYPVTIAATSNNSNNQPVQLQNNKGPVDYGSCGKVLIPTCSLDVANVSLHVDAVAGVTSSTVPLLDLPPAHGPANGYRITAITITPNTVIVSGDPVQLAKVHSITLPAVDLSGRTSDATFPVAIPYPEGISSTVATATIKYSISANPAVSPTPT